MAQRSSDPKAISKETFLSVYKLPGIMGERLFKVFDKKKCGVIDFEDFVTGLERFLRGSIEDKAKMIFEMYDLNNSGYIDSKELSTILHSLIPQQKRKLVGVQRELIASEQHRQFIHGKVQNAFRVCDLNNDGKLPLCDFKLWLNRNPDCVHMMESTFREFSFLGNLNSEQPSSARSCNLVNTSLFCQSPVKDNDCKNLYRVKSNPHLHEKSVFNDSRTEQGGLDTCTEGSYLSDNYKTQSCYNTPMSPHSWNTRESHFPFKERSPESNIHQATCHRCMIIYIFEYEHRQDLDDLEVDPDYSVFNIQNLAGSTKSLHLKACIQCRGDLLQDFDLQSEGSLISGQSDHFQNSAYVSQSSFSSNIDLQIVNTNISMVKEVVVGNPDHIIMQGLLYKKGRTMKIWKARWYVLKDKFLYHYKIAKHRERSSGEPINAQFIQGCTAVIDVAESLKYKAKFCFTLTFQDGGTKKL